MHESRLGRVERYIRPFGTFWQRFRLGRYGPYIGTRDNEDVSTFASSGKDDTDPRDLSGAYAAIRAYAAKLYGGGVVFNAGATGAGADWSLSFIRPDTGMTENVTVVWPSNTPSNGDVLTVLSYAPGLIELEWAAGGGGGGGQAAIQFQDEGSNLGAAGTVDTLDFTGAGVTASRVGDVVTIDVPGSSGGQVDTIVPGDGIDVDSTDPVNPEVSAKISADANNSVSFGSDSGLYVPDNGFYLDGQFGLSDYDDFVRGFTGSVPLRGGYTLTTNVGASSAVNNNFYDAGCAGHQGVIQAVTGTATFGLARVFGAASDVVPGTGFLHLGDGQLEVIWWFRVDALSSGTLRYQIWAGLANRGDGSSPADSIYLIYSDTVNSGVVTLRSIVSSVTQTDAVGTTALAANTWYRARIVINAAMNQADLYLKPYGSAEVHECTYTGSMPAASIGLGLLGSIFKVSGTGSATCCWDRWQYNYRFTNER